MKDIKKANKKKGYGKDRCKVTSINFTQGILDVIDLYLEKTNGFKGRSDLVRYCIRRTLPELLKVNNFIAGNKGKKTKGEPVIVNDKKYEIKEVLW